MPSLMTLAASPVGIDEERRGDAIPRQLYDLDILLASFTNSGQWEAMVAYCSARYARECETWTIDVSAGEPAAGIRERLQRWASCSDSSSERWRTIRALQQSQLRQKVHREPWGWRARCLRLALAVGCIDAEDGWVIWQQALATAALVPASKARRFKNTLAGWRMRTPGRCRSSCTTSCGRCSATERRRLPTESPTHTQRSAPPDPYRSQTGL
jgi:hypothetical protein